MTQSTDGRLRAAFAVALAQLPDAVIAVDAAGKVAFLNEAARALLGLGPEEGVGRAASAVCPGVRVPSGEGLAPLLARVLREGTPQRLPDDAIVLRHDGTRRALRGHAMPLRDDEGALIGALVLAADETEARAAREALRQGEERWRTLWDAAFEGAWVLVDGVIAEVNQAAVDALGYSRDELIGRSATDLAAPASRDAVRRHIQSGSAEPHLAAAIRKDGSELRGELRGRAITYGGAPARITMMRDLSAIHRAQEALRRSEAELRAIFREAGDGIVVTDGEGAIVSANASACRMLGREEAALIGLDSRQLVDVAGGMTFPERWERILAGETLLVSERLRLSDGTSFPAESSIRALEDGRVLVIFRDVSERLQARDEEERLRRQLHQAQKMESIGRLAGGIAHDFNNLMTVVLANASLLEARGEDAEVRACAAEEITAATRRAVELTSKLLAFGRGAAPDGEPGEVDRAVADAAVLIRRLLGSELTVEIELGASGAHVRATEGEIAQVLLNLAVNARDAMPEGGTLAVRTRIRELDGPGAGAEGVAPGSHAELLVSDTGRGMDQDTLSRAFEPFYTTKAADKGTGLGLPMVYGIATRAGGTARVHSRPAQGTVVTVLLPTTSPTPRARRAQPAAPPHGAERILLVEDEPLVARVTRRALESAGYRVLEAQSAEQALALGPEALASIDLLMTDVVMPGKPGPALSRALRAARPSLRVLYVSGYAAGHLGERGVAEHEAFLHKPFDRTQLLAKVREVLDAGR